MDRGADGVVLVYLVQYLAVCVPGVMGGLGVVSMGATAVTFSLLMLLVGEFLRGGNRPLTAGWTALGCAGFVVGYVVALAVYYRHLPVISNDALTYHFPAAASWLQSGKLGVFETWFFNPANSYSPLGGSTFIAWLLAPLANDTIASYVQAPAVVGLWFVVARLGREMGLSSAAAALVGVALVTAQPFIRASVLSKDDVFVAMFFVAALAGLSERLAKDRLGPWRVGVALGLMLAMKYTALLGVPMLMLGMGRIGWGWKKWAIVLGCAAGIAGPWYLRNWVEFGNPVFPVEVRVWGHELWRGILSMRVSGKLRSMGEIWRVLTEVDDAMPAAVLVVMVLGWLGFVVMEWKRIWSDRLVRAVAIGPVVGVGLFLWRAPYAEVRFLYPALAIMMVGMGVGIMRVVRNEWAGLGLLSGAAALTALTGLAIGHGMVLLPIGMAVGGLVIAVDAVRRRMEL
ncbi:MAG TPA: hypothetical protein VFE58_11365, partial [Tepidisphaeraceae bacterium]|nr:hypothetical protein [Tepidisphaeraceae bacterium]